MAPSLAPTVAGVPHAGISAAAGRSWRRVIRNVSDTKRLALVAAEAALEKKALEPVLLDVRGATSYTDFILVVSGRSDRQVQSIADGIVERMAKERVRPLGVEGDSEGQWILVDLGDVVVHVFYHQLREFYDLEGLWSDAPRIGLEIPPEARLSAEHAY